MYGGGFYSSKKSPSSLLGTTRMGKQTLDTMEVGIILTTSLQNCICSFVLLEGIIKTEDFLDGLLGPRVLELRKAHDLVPVVPQDCNVVATCCCPFCWEASKEDLPPFLPLWRIVPFVQVRLELAGCPVVRDALQVLPALTRRSCRDLCQSVLKDGFLGGGCGGGRGSGDAGIVLALPEGEAVLNVAQEPRALEGAPLDRTWRHCRRCYPCAATAVRANHLPNPLTSDRAFPSGEVCGGIILGDILRNFAQVHIFWGFLRFKDRLDLLPQDVALPADFLDAERGQHRAHLRARHRPCDVGHDTVARIRTSGATQILGTTQIRIRSVAVAPTTVLVLVLRHGPLQTLQDGHLCGRAAAGASAAGAAAAVEVGAGRFRPRGVEISAQLALARLFEALLDLVDGLDSLLARREVRVLRRLLQRLVVVDAFCFALDDGLALPSEHVALPANLLAPEGGEEGAHLPPRERGDVGEQLRRAQVLHLVQRGQRLLDPGLVGRAHGARSRRRQLKAPELTRTYLNLARPHKVSHVRQLRRRRRRGASRAMAARPLRLLSGTTVPPHNHLLHRASSLASPLSGSARRGRRRSSFTMVADVFLVSLFRKRAQWLRQQH
mmetsp:Transcript_10470/g.26221  ORF Transcript_10470/g.26221 Transcript_10470/m.26221 type:complete len:608 (-) Transcript_10470:210-2033(-)